LKKRRLLGLPFLPESHEGLGLTRSGFSEHRLAVIGPFLRLTISGEKCEAGRPGLRGDRPDLTAKLTATGMDGG
jgi:hypothetical protein